MKKKTIIKLEIIRMFNKLFRLIRKARKELYYLNRDIRATNFINNRKATII